LCGEFDEKRFLYVRVTYAPVLHRI
jgi:hypothetical protein